MEERPPGDATDDPELENGAEDDDAQGKDSSVEAATGGDGDGHVDGRTDEEMRQGSLREMVGHSLLAGLCPLVPIPFLDDWLRDVARRHQVRRLVSSAGLALEPRAIEILACGYHPVTAQGCVEGCLKSTVMWPVRFLFRLVFKKILRKLVIVLAIKDCVDTFSAVFHETYLVRHALTLAPVPPNAPAGEWIAVRRAIEEVRDEVDPRPVERLAREAFRSSRRLLTASARRAVSLFRRRDELSDEEAYDAFKQTESVELEAVAEELAEEIRGQAGYLQDLERRLFGKLGGDRPQRQ